MTGRVGQVLEIAFPPFTPRITFTAVTPAKGAFMRLKGPISVISGGL